MDVRKAFNQNKRHIIKRVDKESSWYYDSEKKAFTYTIYDKVDEEIITDLTEELLTIIQDALFDKTEVIFEDSQILGFLRKYKIINIEKDKTT